MDVKRYTPRAIGCRSIPLGKQGETNAVRVEFLCAEWLNEYPAARIELHVTIPDGTAYTAKLEESGSTRAWSVTEPYTAQSGTGTIELILRDAATSTVIKSVTGRTHVEKSPSADGQPAIPPDESGLNGYVRYDVAQELTAEERKRARENIGADGAGGVGGYYKPSVDAEGNLTWEKSAEAMPDAEGANIRGPEGKEGKQGATGPQGPQGTPGHTPYIGENGNWWINGVDTGTPATPQGGSGTVTGVQIGSAAYAPNDEGVIDLSGMTAPDAAKLGGRAPEYYLQPVNLLDNSYWKNPKKIVNQRGQTSYTSSTVYYVYTLDRWIITNGTLTIKDGFVNFATNTASAYKRFKQRISGQFKIGQAYTIALRARINAFSGRIWIRTADNGGTIGGGNNIVIDGGIGVFKTYICTSTPTTAQNAPEIEILVFNTETDTVDMDIEWMAIYEGTYTLETLPPCAPKGYAAELAECQRFFRRINVRNGYMYVMAYNATSARMYLPFGMRTEKPTVQFDSAINLLKSGTSETATITSVAGEGANESMMFMNISSSGLTAGAFYILYPGDAIPHIDISADL